MKRVLILFAAIMAAFGAAAELKVSLLTFYPGPEIYELDGHTALRIYGDDRPDLAYNWGTFDFNTPNFVYRFVKGETDYTLEAVPTYLFVEHYRRAGRRVVEQTLSLTPAQVSRLDSLIGLNLRPENRLYRYNYVLDNCATRPLRILESALGDTLRPAGTVAAADTTFRAAMHRSHRAYPWYQFGIDLALGSGLDRPVTNRERTFLPLTLMEYIAGAHVRDAATGAERPIVSRTEVIFDVAPDAAVLPPTPLWLTPQLWGWAVFAIVTLLSWRDYIRGRSSRWLDTLLFGIYGIAGLLLTFLIFVSVHEATSPNWLYLWLNPLCLVGAIGPWIKSARKLVICWQFVNFALVFVLGLIALTGVQNLNQAFWPLMLAAQMRNITDIHCYRCTATARKIRN